MDINIRLKEDVLGNVQGITIHGIPTRTFLKGEIVQISKQDHDQIKKIGYEDYFEIISEADFQKFLKESSEKAEAEVKRVRKAYQAMDDAEGGRDPSHYPGPGLGGEGAFTGVEPKKRGRPRKEETMVKYTKDDLTEMTFPELRKIGNTFGVKGRSFKGLVRDILIAQGE